MDVIRRPCTRASGFTLVELSIVLVIIGLIIGAVLVGRDMIRGAEIRATISQIEKYNAAANTFRDKFNGLPGDLRDATNFGFVARTGTVGRGNGDGLIEGGYASGVVPCGETVMFWSDLSTASLIDGNFQGGDGSPALGTCTASSATVPVSQLIPAAKLGRGGSILIYAATGLNYYQIAGGIPVTAGGNSFSALYVMTPSDAFRIDTKLDDGYPTTGIVLSADSWFRWNGPAPSAGAVGTTAQWRCGNADQLQHGRPSHRSTLLGQHSDEFLILRC